MTHKRNKTRRRHASYTLNRPDGALLCRVLEQHTNDAAGAILRLAWWPGLMRDEIQHLTWAQVDLLGEQLLLPGPGGPAGPGAGRLAGGPAPGAERQQRTGGAVGPGPAPLAAQSILPPGPRRSWTPGT